MKTLKQNLHFRKTAASAFMSLLGITGSQALADESIFAWSGSNSTWISPAAEYDRLTSDRPHVSEATSTVGVGRWQLETGYTFTQDSSEGVKFRGNSYPESLMRIGAFQDWFELRIAANYLSENQTTIGGDTLRFRGYDDLYLGSKIALVKQYGILPDITVFPQMRVPTGSNAFSSGRLLPGLNIAYSWAINSLIELECNTVINGRRSEGDRFTEFMQTANVEYDLGPRWIYFTEFFIIQTTGQAPSELTQTYFHTGLQHFVLPNVQVDVHSAVGLNQAADNLAFTGCGLCILW